MTKSVLAAIRANPLAYLPEVSLSLLRSFREGYDLRYRMEGQQYDWRVSFGRFEFWIRRRYHVPGVTISSAEPVLLSLCRSQREAFYKYFELLDQFEQLSPEQLEPPRELKRKTKIDLMQAMVNDPQKYIGWPISDLVDSSAPAEPGEFVMLREESAAEPTFDSIGQKSFFGTRTAPTPPQPWPPRKTLAEIIRTIRKCPRIRNIPTFRGCCAYLMGHERAQDDLGVGGDQSREVLDGFKRWVETVQNQAKPRPWLKVILYRSGFSECVSCEGSAFNLFFQWLDEYAQTVGQPDLFVASEADAFFHQ